MTKNILQIDLKKDLSADFLLWWRQYRKFSFPFSLIYLMAPWPSKDSHYYFLFYEVRSLKRFWMNVINFKYLHTSRKDPSVYSFLCPSAFNVLLMSQDFLSKNSFLFILVNTFLCLVRPVSLKGGEVIIWIACFDYGCLWK